MVVNNIQRSLVALHLKETPPDSGGKLSKHITFTLLTYSYLMLLKIEI